MAKGQKNLLLASLSAEDMKLLEPHLEEANLPLRKRLEVNGRPIKASYFLESGLASVVANGKKLPIEVGLIGREGMTGLALALGRDRGSNEIYMQVAGRGLRIPAHALRQAIDASATLHWSLLHYVHAFLNQTMRTAVANARSKIDERLARWLLMASDRLDKSEIAMMLGVQRPGVTIAMQGLERRGLVTCSRGQVIIVDRQNLEKVSNGAYSGPDKF
jgi:CRP-like cAMP-binding protein